jgi:Mlc titration factor MtfA (ptsG expression regulator)
MFDWWRRLSRAEAIEQEFPAEYRRLLEEQVPLVKLLTAPELAKLEALVRVLLSEKAFEAAGGLELTEEMCVTIAARACLLVLHRVELDEPLFSELDTIVVYPSTYRARQERQEGYVVVEGDEARLGESWTRGVIVLSWDAVAAGSRNPRDGHDVVLHEFAHQLDAEDGAMDGTPELGALARYAAWARVASAEYGELYEAVQRHEKTSLDPYGATNAPEFFAVVVEHFFERPGDLARKHPELYRELATFFRFDPVERLQRESS